MQHNLLWWTGPQPVKNEGDPPPPESYEINIKAIMDLVRVGRVVETARGAFGDEVSALFERDGGTQKGRKKLLSSLFLSSLLLDLSPARCNTMMTRTFVHYRLPRLSTSFFSVESSSSPRSSASSRQGTSRPRSRLARTLPPPTPPPRARRTRERTRRERGRTSSKMRKTTSLRPLPREDCRRRSSTRRVRRLVSYFSLFSRPSERSELTLCVRFYCSQNLPTFKPCSSPFSSRPTSSPSIRHNSSRHGTSLSPGGRRSLRRSQEDWSTRRLRRRGMLRTRGRPRGWTTRGQSGRTSIGR